MTDENRPPVDLFGQPWQDEGETRGRPAHVYSAQIAETIAVLRAAGSTETEIATRVGLSEPTMRKYYFRILESGAAVARSILRERLWKAAMAGNVSAAKALEAIFDKGDAAVPQRRRAGADAGDGEAEAGKLGKKASADAAAGEAHKGTSWGDILH